MICERPVTTLLQIGAAGVILGGLVLGSPLTVGVLLAAPVVMAWLARGLPPEERRALVGLLGLAFGLRLAVIAAQLVAGIPWHSVTAVGALEGDESYYLSRALRSRDLLVGFAASKYDFFVATDDYGRTSYLSLLTLIQVVFGPTPFAMKALNALLFVTGAGLLFRLARSAFGPVPAGVGLAVLVFLPSLFMASVSLLKESLYSLILAVFLLSAVAAARRVRSRDWSALLRAAAPGVAALWLLNDLRRGALALAVAGLVTALAMAVVGTSRRRLAMAAGAALLAGGGIAAWPTAQAQALAAVSTAAKVHAGHVFTIGHAYKLLDDEFYKQPNVAASWDLRLTPDQAARFLLRSAVSIVVTPWPWELRSWSELAFLPELLVWYGLVLAFPIGVAAGWRRAPDTVAVLVGNVVCMAAALAVTTGNVGTLLRLRGLLLPALVWISAVGICIVADHLVQRRRWPAAWNRPVTEGIQP